MRLHGGHSKLCHLFRSGRDLKMDVKDFEIPPLKRDCNQTAHSGVVLYSSLFTITAMEGNVLYTNGKDF